MRRIPIVVALLGALTLSGCSAAQQPGAQSSAPAAGSAPAAASGGTFAVITHGRPGDAFWDVVKNGAEAAGKQYGVDGHLPGRRRPGRQSQLIDQAVQQKVDGIVVSMANPDALKESIGKAVAAEHPGRHHQLRRRPVQGVRRDHPCRPVRGRRRARRGREAQGRRRHQAALRHPRGRQRRPRPALQRRRRGALGGTVEQLQVDVEQPGRRDLQDHRQAAVRHRDQRRAHAQPGGRRRRPRRRSPTPGRRPSSPPSTCPPTWSPRSRTARSSSPSTSSSTCRATCRSPSSTCTRTTSTPSAAASRCYTGPGFVDQGQRRRRSPSWPERGTR